MHREAGLDVKQTFPVGQLAEIHGPILFGAGKRPNSLTGAEPVDDLRTGRSWQEVHDMGEQDPANVHQHLLGRIPKNTPSNSNRHHTISNHTPKKFRLSKTRPFI